MAVNMAEMVENFINVRNARKALKKQFEEDEKDLKETEQLLGGFLLKHLETTGVDSVKTGSGTFFKSSKSSASVVDAEAFMAHIIEQKDFDLLERRASVAAVEAYISKRNEAPPGVHYSSITTLNVRSPAKKVGGGAAAED